MSTPGAGEKLDEAKVDSPLYPPGEAKPYRHLDFGFMASTGVVE